MRRFEEIAIMAGGVVLAVSIVLGLLGFVYVWDAYVCESTAQEMQLRYTYKFSTGCMVEDRADHFVPLKLYRVLN